MITYKTVKVTVTVLAYIDGEGGDDHEGDFQEAVKPMMSPTAKVNTAWS